MQKHFVCCGRSGLSPFGLWPFRSVAVSVCGRFGLWAFRSVAVLVSGRSGLWPFRFVAFPVCGRFGVWRYGLLPDGIWTENIQVEIGIGKLV